MQIAAPATANPLVTATRTTLAGAVHDLEQVVGMARTWKDVDPTKPYWSASITQHLGSASGRLEAMRGVFELGLGLDIAPFWGAVSEVNQAITKSIDAVDRHAKPWRPLFDMIASDARRAIAYLRTVDADLARHAG